MPPARQRTHYVLAEDAATAHPIINAFKDLGVTDVRYIGSSILLGALDPDTVTFVFGPGHADHPNATNIRRMVDNLISTGATVKRAPKPKSKPKPPLPKRAPAKGPALKDRDLLDLATVDELLRKLKDIPVTTVTIPQAAPDPAYKQIMLGGPLHGQRVRQRLNPRQDRIRTIDPPVLRLDVLRKPETQEAPAMEYRDYLRSDLNIFGAQITFWVYERQWSERNKLARDFLLFPLEA
ncbi:hypothetical protein ACWDTT_33280 [Streptosporangium sandarakinum]